MTSWLELWEFQLDQEVCNHTVPYWLVSLLHQRPGITAEVTGISLPGIGISVQVMGITVLFMGISFEVTGITVLRMRITDSMTRITNSLMGISKTHMGIAYNAGHSQYDP